MKPAAAILTALLSLPAPAIAAEPGPDLYTRVEARLAADPKLAAALGKPTPEITAAGWMVGEWDIVAAVEAGATAGKEDRGRAVVSYVLDGNWLELRDTYPKGNQDIGYLSFNPLTRRWISLSLDSLGNAVTTTSPGWEDGRLVFTGDAVVVGEPVSLRQTIRRQGTDAYEVVNEERMTDGSWKRLDAYHYVRRPKAP